MKIKSWYGVRTSGIGYRPINEVMKQLAANAAAPVIQQQGPSDVEFEALIQCFAELANRTEALEAATVELEIAKADKHAVAIISRAVEELLKAVNVLRTPVDGVLVALSIPIVALSIQVPLDKSDALVAKNPSGLSRIRVKEGYFSRISRIRRPKIVRVIEGPTYRSPTYRGAPVPILDLSTLTLDLSIPIVDFSIPAVA